jgi:hypothetical protein
VDDLDPVADFVDLDDPTAFAEKAVDVCNPTIFCAHKRPLRIAGTGPVYCSGGSVPVVWRRIFIRIANEVERGESKRRRVFLTQN